MKHPRALIAALVAIVAATILVAVAAGGVALSSGVTRGATTAASPSGASAATATSGSACREHTASAVPGSGGAATGTTGATGVADALRFVNPGGPMIPAGASPPPAGDPTVTVSRLVVVTAGGHVPPDPGPVRGL
jgi:hypothetical protein